eukprot:52649-Pelagomonas_calceolata.AAC.3
MHKRMRFNCLGACMRSSIHTPNWKPELVDTVKAMHSTDAGLMRHLWKGWEDTRAFIYICPYKAWSTSSLLLYLAPMTSQHQKTLYAYKIVL